jgi:hypothetical protein
MEWEPGNASLNLFGRWIEFILIGPIQDWMVYGVGVILRPLIYG